MSPSQSQPSRITRLAEFPGEHELWGDSPAPGISHKLPEPCIQQRVPENFQGLGYWEAVQQVRLSSGCEMDKLCMVGHSPGGHYLRYTKGQLAWPQQDS